MRKSGTVLTKSSQPWRELLCRSRTSARKIQCAGKERIQRYMSDTMENDHILSKAGGMYNQKIKIKPKQEKVFSLGFCGGLIIFFVVFVGCFGLVFFFLFS